MSKNFPEILQDLNSTMVKLRSELPDTMDGFARMATAAKGAGALDAKTKELIAVAISVAGRCDACIASHVKGALDHGASRAEFLDMLRMAIYMGGGPSAAYGAQALRAYDQFSGD
jgi:AhpD family alkylhydroperoxidase